MTDSNTLSLVIPSISLGYKVSDDPEGKLIFENDSCVISYDKNANSWLMTDITGLKYNFGDLKVALIDGAE